MSKAAQRQWLVKITSRTIVFDGYFATKSGGEKQADASEVWDGGSLIPDILSGPPTTSNISVSRAFDPARDNSLLAQCRQQVGKLYADISCTPTDADLVALSDGQVNYSNCLLVRVGEPQFSAASGDSSAYELEFKPSRIA